MWGRQLPPFPQALGRRSSEGRQAGLTLEGLQSLEDFCLLIRLCHETTVCWHLIVRRSHLPGRYDDVDGAATCRERPRQASIRSSNRAFQYR